MPSIDNIRNNILNNNYDLYKEKIIRIKKNNKKINIPDNAINKLSSDLQKLSYIVALTNIFSNKDTINKKGFLKKLTNEINTVTQFNLSNNDTFNLLKESINVKKNLSTLTNNKYVENNIITMKGGFFSMYFGWKEDTSFFSKTLDIVTLILDFAGIIPGVGLPLDAANIILTAIKGNYILAAITFISLVPVIGTFGPLIKAIYKQWSRNKAAWVKDKNEEKNNNKKKNDDEDEDEEDEDYDEDEDEDEDK